MISKFKAQQSINQRGYLLVTVLFISIVLTMIGLTLLGDETEQYTLANNDMYSVNALYTAEAGIEQSIYQLNNNTAFVGFTNPVSFVSNAQSNSSYTTVVADVVGSNAKTITSTGIAYRGSNTTPVAKHIIKVTVVGTNSTGYSTITGPGGLLLSGSADITNGPIYVNGSISMSGASTIGTAQLPLDVYVANDDCPTGPNPGSSYPQICNDVQPISLQYSTNIYGSVCATGQTSTGPNNNIKTGNGGLGLELGCTAPVVSPPSYNRAAQIAAVTTTADSNNSQYLCSGNANINWPANLELTGNVSIGNSCNLTINGNVYITGNLTINGAATITAANSLEGNLPVVIVDGTINVSGSANMLANSSGTGIKYISFDSAASCGASCSSLSGNDLYNSQQQTTVTIGGAVNLPGMIFQSYWGTLALSGSGHIGAVAGQVINMDGAGTIVFGTTLSSGTTTWTISSYQQLQ